MLPCYSHSCFSSLAQNTSNKPETAPRNWCAGPGHHACSVPSRWLPARSTALWAIVISLSNVSIFLSTSHMAQLVHICWPLLRAVSVNHTLLEKQTEKEVHKLWKVDVNPGSPWCRQEICLTSQSLSFYLQNTKGRNLTCWREALKKIHLKASGTW